MEVEHDPISGQKTTGHEWDGVKELNTPIPKAAKWAYGIALTIAVTMWILLPAFPTFKTYTKGLLGRSDAKRVASEMEQLNKSRSAFESELNKADLEKLVNDPKARKKYYVAGKTLFRDNCAVCHGRDGKGQLGFPNLTDSTWLYEGTAEGIYTTIKHGINSTSDETHSGEMPAFGKDETLDDDQIADVAEFVLSISGQKHLPKAAARGKEIFGEECASCHGDNGEGNTGTGAPSLNDSSTIYGMTRDKIRETVHNGRAGVMPQWQGRLREAQIRELALYVKWLSMDTAKQAKSAAADGKTAKTHKDANG